MTTLAFVDTETTGLDPDRHEVWEVALILRQTDGPHTDPDHPSGYVDTEYVWQLPVDLGRADPIALNIGRFHERRYGLPTHSEWARAALAGGIDGRDVVAPPQMADWAALFAKLTWGAHLIGAVPSFDEERLRRLLRANGACPGWHYHLIDVEALAVGYLNGSLATEWTGETARAVNAANALPWKSRDLSRAIGVDPEQFDEHTALGDARWARAIYDAIVGQ